MANLYVVTIFSHLASDPDLSELVAHAAASTYNEADRKARQYAERLAAEENEFRAQNIAAARAALAEAQAKEQELIAAGFPIPKHSTETIDEDGVLSILIIKYDVKTGAREYTTTTTFPLYRVVKVNTSYIVLAGNDDRPQDYTHSDYADKWIINVLLVPQ
jgi:hypothetical protein